MNGFIDPNEYLLGRIERLEILVSALLSSTSLKELDGIEQLCARSIRVDANNAKDIRAYRLLNSLGLGPLDEPQL